MILIVIFLTLKSAICSDIFIEFTDPLVLQLPSNANVYNVQHIGSELKILYFIDHKYTILIYDVIKSKNNTIGYELELNSRLLLNSIKVKICKIYFPNHLYINDVKFEFNSDTYYYQSHFELDEIEFVIMKLKSEKNNTLL